jgi:hypothetical protein
MYLTTMKTFGKVKIQTQTEKWLKEHGTNVQVSPWYPGASPAYRGCPG